MILPVAAVLALALTPAQERGKQLYLTGESAAKRPVTALLGDDDVEVAASVVPCASCHARDGRGREEGGLRPPSLQWDVLTHALSTAQRTRAAYTRSQLTRAVAMGIDADGKRLQKTMPRYRMALEDMQDLLAYLEQLGNDREPGLTDDAVRIGFVLPSGSAEQAAVRAALTAYAERVNGDGGVFGRRIVPVFTTTAGAEELERFLIDEQPFAIGAAWLTGADAALSAVAERHGVPLIASASTGSPGDDRYVFRLLAGIREQSLALAAAAKLEPQSRIAVIGAQPAMREALVNAGYQHAESPDTADAVLFLGLPSQLRTVLAAAAAAPTPPRVLIPAAHSSGDITSAPAALDGRIFVALPSSPDDVTGAGAAELQVLGVASAHATACRLALAGTKLLVEALRRTGRDIERDAVVATLQTFYRAPTNLTPPITWTRAHHTGTRAARILRVDLARRRWADLGWWP